MHRLTIILRACIRVRGFSTLPHQPSPTQLAIRPENSAKPHLAVHVWEGAMRSCSTWRLNSFNLNLKEQSQTGDFLAQMDGDLPGQGNSVNVGYVCHHQRADPSSLTRTVNLNVRSSILQGASMPVISGGEFNSIGGDYNRITIKICKTLSSELRFLFKNRYLDQGVQQHRDNRHESVSSLPKEQHLFC